jgi:hypothetical protein
VSECISQALPHEGVLTRLGVSAIHGIGVFALCDIPVGTNVFANDQRPLVWVEEAELARLPLTPEQRAFYDDFAIHRDGRLGCPTNFDLLSPGWYVNQPGEGEAPNLVPDAEDKLIAARDIASGEELTLRYSDFGAP